MVVEEVVDEVEHGDHVDHVLFDELAPTQFHQEFHSSCSHHPKSAHGFAMDGSGVQEGLGDVSQFQLPQICFPQGSHHPL